MDNFTVHGYTCNYLDKQTDHTRQYRAFAPDGHPVMVTEYFMQGACTRQPDGQILIQETDATRFKEGLFHFVEKANILRELENSLLPTPLDIFYENGTAYVIWPIAEGFFWQSYMKTQGTALSLQDRLNLFLPLIRQLDQLAAQNIFYQFQDNELIIRESGELAINSMFQPDISFGKSLESTTKLIYFALSGADYPGGNASSAMRQNVSLLLNGQQSIHNFDSLYNLFKDCILFPHKVPEGAIGSVPLSNSPTAPSQSMNHTPDQFSPVAKENTVQLSQGKIAAIAITIVALVIVLIVGFKISSNIQNQFNNALGSAIASNSGDALPTNSSDAVIDVTEDIDQPIDIEEEFLNNTVHQDADRNGDARIIYDRSIIANGDELIYRHWNQGWHLSKDDGTNSVNLASDIFPAFLVVANDYVYFTDSFQDHHVYRVPLSGGTPELVLAQPVMSFAIDHDSIYYGNINDNYSLYQAPIGSSDVGQLVLDTPTYDIFSDPVNQLLYFTNDERAAYRMDLKTTESQILDDKENYNIRFSNQTLYTVQENDDDTTSIYAYGSDGIKQTILDHVTSYKYDVNGDYLYYIDYSTSALNRQNLKTGEHSQITTDVNAYWLNGIGSNVIYWYNSPGGQLIKWTKEENITPIDRGVGTFDYQPLTALSLERLKEEDAYGTNVTNLAHGGNVVKDVDGNLYFEDFYKATGGNGIYSVYNAFYRYSPDGQSSRIGNSVGRSLFINDNFAYYPTYSDTIEKISLESGKTSTVANIDAVQLYPYQDRMYVVDDDDNVFVMNFDGSEQTQILTAEASSIIVYQDHIYFMSKTDRNHVYWCDLEGLNKNPLADLDVDSFSISNGKIYYVSENSVFESELDGTNVKLIQTLDSSMRSATIYPYKEWLYLISGSGLSNKLSRLRIDGSVYEPIFESNDFTKSSFTILDDHLYYTLDDLGSITGYTFYRSDLNGDNSELLIND